MIEKYYARPPAGKNHPHPRTNFTFPFPISSVAIHINCGGAELAFCERNITLRYELACNANVTLALDHPFLCSCNAVKPQLGAVGGRSGRQRRLTKTSFSHTQVYKSRITSKNYPKWFVMFPWSIF